MTEIEGKLYALVTSSPILRAEGSKGPKFWQAHVLRGTDGRFYTSSSAWHTTSTGKTSKIIWAVPYYAEPKNVGRSNETSNEQQAHAEFTSMVAKEVRLREQVRMQAQSAKKVSDHLKKLKYPIIVQPKYDGMRLLTTGPEVWSRGNKDAVMRPIAHIFPLAVPDVTLDGELTFRDHTRQVNEVMSAAKKYQPGVSETLIYTVYDLADEKLPYVERLRLLTAIVEDLAHPSVRVTEGWIANNYDEAMAIHTRLTEAGWEGTIWRNPQGKYRSGKKSSDVLKHKDFQDAEYEILNVVPQGGGIGERRAKFICVDGKGDQFESNATGTEDEQMEYLVNKALYIGKWAKVKFRELSGAAQVPFHSNVLEVRETQTGGF